MYEIKQKKVKVNGIGFDTYERTIHDACDFTVEVGTNGYKGGDAKKGSRTMLSIKSGNGASVATLPLGKNANCSGGFVLALSGDSELYGLLNSLKFAVKVLEDQIMEVRD